MIKAIIFDCFGVVRTDTLIETYKYFGGDPAKDQKLIYDTIQAASAGKIPSSVPVFTKHLGIDPNEWNKVITSIGAVDYEVLDYVQELRKKYKVAMLSNIGKGGLGRFFEPGFLEKYFDEVVSSGDIGYAKPEAQAYEITADRLGVRLDECVFTDDRQDYIDGALAVGMQGILYENLTQFKADLNKLLG